MAEDGEDTSREPTRVQTLVDAGVTHLPPRYIQPQLARPTPHLSSPRCLPLVDLDSAHLDEVRTDVARACAEWGTFLILGHGVPARLLEDVRAAGLAFFRDTSPEERMGYACDPSVAVSEGYGSRLLSSDGGVLDWRDYFDHHTLPISRRDPSRWPRYPRNYSFSGKGRGSRPF